MSAGPRVVFLTDIVTPYMVAVLEALADRVDLTVVFCAKTGSRGAEWAFADPFRFSYRVLGGLAIPRHDSADLYPTPRILHALAELRPAVVISGAFSFPTAFAALYGRLSGARLIIHSDGTSISERGLGRAHGIARTLLLRRAAVCVGNSEPAVARFVELGVAADRVLRAPHSTSLTALHAVARDRFGKPEPDGPMTVLHVGRLIPRKGIDRLVRAMAMAVRDAPVRLLLVGSGAEEDRLRRLTIEQGVEAAVEFRGFVDQPDLPAVYAESDAFAFPTLMDPFGIVVLEAAAAGLPIVASPYGGATLDLVVEGRNGFVAAPDDTAAWARALVDLASDPKLRRRYGEAGHAATLTRTPAAAAEGYAAAVEAALRLPGARLGRLWS